MDNVAEKYSVTFINIRTATHVSYPVYSIDEFYNEHIKVSGVCILFDVYGEMIEVIASYDDIVRDAYENVSNREVDCYCLVVEEEDELTEDEVDVFFYGIKGNIIDVHNIKKPCSITVFASQN
jgi:hypothetical protein